MEQTQTTELDEPDDYLNFRGKAYKDLTFEDMNDVEFRSIDEVDQFYSFYSLATGFSMRKNKLDKNRAGTLVLRRQLVCSKEGVRRGSELRQPDVEHRSQPPVNVGHKRNSSQKTVHEKGTQSRRITRGNCPASLTARFCTERGVYYVSEFVTVHNHDLTIAEHRQFLRSHRKVGESDVATVNSLRRVSVRTCYAYQFLVQQAGGYEFVGFTLKDLYNKLQGEKAEIMLDGDSQSSITWMNMKAMQDPYFYCIFSIDEKGRLANMFWRDGQSLRDYNAFGDVLILDTTYKSNIYEKPLAVLVGCNNHRATVLFGCALLVNEKEETYLWLLKCFITSMYGKKPISVITDGDDAMRNAVARLIPDARHRLCSWHIGRNVGSNLKGLDTQRDFCHLIFAGLTIEEWEAGWQYFVSMNNLQNNKWVTSMYNKRDRWAEAFFRDHFFGGICSTQRCEGMHRNLKGGVRRHLRLFEVLPRMDKTIGRIRNRVAEDDYRSIHYEPVCGSHMRCLQEDIGRIFTHDIFLLIKDQINYETKFVVTQRVVHPTTGATAISVTQYAKPDRKWTVWYQADHTNPTFNCSCKLFESDGIPCCHIFAAMKIEMVTKIPDSLVKKRWTKDASVKKPSIDAVESGDVSLQIARYGELMSICSEMCHTASYIDQLYEQTKEALGNMNLRTQQQRRCRNSGKEHWPKDGLHPNVIRDPVVCRTKGSRSKQGKENFTENDNSKGGAKCTMCGNPGHNRRTCSMENNPSSNRPASAPNSRPQPDSYSNTTTSSPEDLSPTHSMNSTDYSESDTEYEASTHNDPTHLFHHREEERPFQFVGGYDQTLTSGSMGTRFTTTSSSHPASPFPSP